MTWITPQPEFEPSIDALIAQLETMLRQRHQRQRVVMYQPPRERALRRSPLPVGHRRDQPDVPCLPSARPVPAACAKTPATEKALAVALPRDSFVPLLLGHDSVAPRRRQQHTPHSSAPCTRHPLGVQAGYLDHRALQGAELSPYRATRTYGATPMSKTADVATLLNDLDAGVFAERLNAAMRDTVLGVTTTGKKGSVTVKFDFEQIGDSNQVKCTHAVRYAKPTLKGKATEEATTSTPLHVLKGGVLSLFPEKQEDMFGRPGAEGAERGATAH